MTSNIGLQIDDKTFTLHETSAAAAEAAAERAEAAAEEAASHGGLTEEIKAALLQIARKVVYLDDGSPSYYDALENALYADRYPMITAIYTPSTAVIYTDDTLDTLKQYLTVTLYQSKDDTGTEIASSDYTLSGTLTEGTSIITVTYNNLRASVHITGVVDFYNIWEWSIQSGDVAKIGAYSLDFNANVASRISIRNVSTRRTYGVPKGRVPYYTADGNEPTAYFPIPIPAGANKVSVSITPSSQYLYLNIARYDTEQGQYFKYTDSGWAQGVNTKTFTAGDNLFLFFNSKYDSAGSSYPTEPSNVVITFEEV